jgi:hypothetical protein
VELIAAHQLVLAVVPTNITLPWVNSVVLMEAAVRRLWAQHAAQDKAHMHPLAPTIALMGSIVPMDELARVAPL